MLSVEQRTSGKHGAGMSDVRPVFAETLMPLTVTAVIVLYRMKPRLRQRFRA